MKDNYGLTKKEMQYVYYMFEGKSKREAYSLAFNIDNLDSCSTLVGRLEAKKKKQLEEYTIHLREELEDKYMPSIKQLQLYWYNIMIDDKYPITQRIRASELLGKSMGAFTDNLNVKADINEQIIFIDNFDDMKD